MQVLVFALVIFQSVTSFATQPIRTETAAALMELRSKIRTWAPTCQDGSMTLHECPFGDALEYEGMLCLSGDKKNCDIVKSAQSADGQFWRSPGLINVPGTGAIGPNRPQFSRDMTKGVFAYLIATRDTEAATRWIQFIESNDNHLCRRNPQTKKHYQECYAGAGFWALAARIWDYMGLKRTKKMNGLKFKIEGFYYPLEAHFTPIGYQSILKAEGAFLVQQLLARTKYVQDADTRLRIAKIIYRREKENPFYAYLAKGPGESTAQFLLNHCPASAPTAMKQDAFGPIYSWSIGERLSNDPFKRSSGHDCILMINLLIGPEA